MNPAPRSVFVRRVGFHELATDAVTLQMSDRLVHIQHQYADKVGFWFEVGHDVTPQARTFRCWGTGFPIADGWEWRATLLLSGGELVLHVYEQVADA